MSNTQDTRNSIMIEWMGGGRMVLLWLHVILLFKFYFLIFRFAQKWLIFEILPCIFGILMALSLARNSRDQPWAFLSHFQERVIWTTFSVSLLVHLTCSGYLMKAVDRWVLMSQLPSSDSPGKYPCLISENVTQVLRYPKQWYLRDITIEVAWICVTSSQKSWVFSLSLNYHQVHIVQYDFMGQHMAHIAQYDSICQHMDL